MAIKEDIERGINVEENDLAEPLVKQKDVASGSEESSSNGEDSLRMVLLSTAMAVYGSFEFGLCVGYSAPTQSGIRTDIGLTLAEYAVFGSVLTVGAMIGAITSGRIADFFGRKGAMRVSATVCIIGWLVIYFAKDALMLYFGRLSTGYGLGVLSYVVPVFIAEIAPKNLRGALTTLNQLLICAGGSTAFIIGTFVNWRILAAIGLLPCFSLLAGLFLIPESPRWLARMGNQKEYEVALQKLRGENADVSREAAEIEEYIETLQSLPKAKVQDLFQSGYIHSVIVAFGLMMLQQLGGVNAIGFYASETFVSAGFASGNLGNILIGCIQVPITAAGAILMDKSGRRPLLMVSASGTFVGCFLTGISFYLKGHEFFLEWVPSLALSGILVYSGSFSIGMGPVPWVMMSEIFHINIKGIAGSLATLISWFGSWLMTYAFNFLMSWSPSGTFFLFSAASAITVLFVARVVPETKGKTLEEIQASLNKKEAR
ncbi:uncharacterized protein A4U43_C07F9280 [Asparagus officinalis]|uniref:Major facilitator superfamily (MFS) profile domain-containing protein n=1 Tax=Asparagus officinalis TaxID=4686 RepID=A0A5P1EDM3_ASPOF|nr:sugar transporter ERD6-like 16 [Asparagus officinalis]ONK62899.1 uncharacterized protein A4U43_C07F9280 [Asparagus officinalis]